jgi:hypothetical protein
MTTLRMTTPFCLHQCGRSGASGGEYCAFGRAVPSACMEEVPDMAALEVTHSAPNDLGDSLRRPEPRHPCGHCPAEQPMQHQFQLSRSEARRWAMAFHLHRRGPRTGPPSAVEGRTWMRASGAAPPA